MSKAEKFHEWLNHGVTEGWVSFVVCETHDAVPVTDEEMDEFDDGYDPCIPVIRVWEHEING